MSNCHLTMPLEYHWYHTMSRPVCNINWTRALVPRPPASLAVVAPARANPQQQPVGLPPCAYLILICRASVIQLHRLRQAISLGGDPASTRSSQPNPKRHRHQGHYVSDRRDAQNNSQYTEFCSRRTCTLPSTTECQLRNRRRLISRCDRDEGAPQPCWRRWSAG